MGRTYDLCNSGFGVPHPHPDPPPSRERSGAAVQSRHNEAGVSTGTMAPDGRDGDLSECPLCLGPLFMGKDKFPKGEAKRGVSS